MRTTETGPFRDRIKHGGELGLGAACLGRFHHYCIDGYPDEPGGLKAGRAADRGGLAGRWSLSYVFTDNISKISEVLS